MINIIIKIFNFILPPRCISCLEILHNSNGICSKCFNQINFISSPHCFKCGIPFESTKNTQKSQLFCGKCIKNKKNIFEMQRSAMIYDEFSKKIILPFKFNDKTENAKILAKYMINAGKDIFENDIDLIIPIPLHMKRLLKRKYNQSALLAKEISKKTNFEIDYSSVKRAKNNRPQVEFKGKARVKNVKDIFEIKDAKKIKGKNIILIDDVYTTGSTLKECAKTLKKAGARNLYSLTIART